MQQSSVQRNTIAFQICWISRGESGRRPWQMHQWTASPRLSESNIWRGKRSGRDIRVHHLSGSDALLKSRPSYLSGLHPNIHRLRNRRQAATSVFHDPKRSRNNVADRVGEFLSLRLILPSRPKETGRTRQSQSGGNTVFLVVKKKKIIIIVIIPARLKSQTRVWFLPLIIVWINAFKCLTCECMTDAWIPLHTHSHFSHLDAKM